MSSDCIKDGGRRTRRTSVFFRQRILYVLRFREVWGIAGKVPPCYNQDVCILSRVLQPPGGGSSISFGVEENVKPQQSRANKTASNIFGPPVDSQPAVRRSNPPGGKSSGIFGATGSEASDLKQRRNPPGGKTSGIFDSVTTPGTRGSAAGEGNEGEKCPSNKASETEEKPRGLKEEPVLIPAEPAAARPRKNPPGGMSSLVLG
uniref:Hematological and neurological expressed 1-like protein n=1 Tax=Callorhinchus milii TaxID=7868 RepID=A0A4W3GDI2_CALMI|eukprot:gi/632943496/ref/XP_007886980.1/ PREDICTED: hematological and neurological expressed 1 protein isoform X2 [Callorhinchus milii]